MDERRLLEIIHTAGRLKDVTRHAYTSCGRHESVAEHSWRIALTAMFLKDEFPHLDIDKVVRMCLIHDLGEIFTGDIPTFAKTDADTLAEDELLDQWVGGMPSPVCEEMRALYAEMNALETDEAKLYKALDKLEAVIQHNESPINTWEPLEYDLNRSYAYENMAFSPYMMRLRKCVREETEDKIRREGKN